MKKLYELRIIDGRRVIQGPVFGQDNYDDFVNVVKNWNQMNVFRTHDRYHRVILPEQVIDRSYVEIRRISWGRALLRSILRRLFL